MLSSCLYSMYHILRRMIIVCDEVSDTAIEFVITVVRLKTTIKSKMREKNMPRPTMPQSRKHYRKANQVFI